MGSSVKLRKKKNAMKRIALIALIALMSLTGYSQMIAKGSQANKKPLVLKKQVAQNHYIEQPLDKAQILHSLKNIPKKTKCAVHTRL